ncbi:MAG: heavy-metal-associated domain-containing protein [Anaerolineae bacterium]
MAQKKLYVPGINCQHCVMNITRALSAVKGIQNVSGDPDSKMVTVEYTAPADEKAIRNALIEIGYPAE